jgi:hypothetical protein
VRHSPLSWRSIFSYATIVTGVLLLGACYTQDPGAGVNVSVHSVPGILDDTVTDWEKAAFGYRYVRVFIYSVCIAGSSIPVSFVAFSTHRIVIML